MNEDHQLNDYPSLIDIGTCGLHTVHGSLKTSINKSEWGKIKDNVEIPE